MLPKLPVIVAILTLASIAWAAGVEAYNNFKTRCREVMLDLFVFHPRPKVPG